MNLSAIGIDFKALKHGSLTCRSPIDGKEIGSIPESSVMDVENA